MYLSFLRTPPPPFYLSCIFMLTVHVFPLKGLLNEHSSYKKHPVIQISTLESYGLPYATSGDK